MTTNELPVTVEIADVKTTPSPPSSEVTYGVRNGSGACIWLVDDDWFTWRQKGKDVEISLKRERLEPGAQVFGYFDPQVLELAPGDATSRTLRLDWPQRLNQAWNEEEFAAPAPGRYSLSIVVGYGRSPAPPPPQSAADVEATVLAWQREARSDTVPLEIPDYELPS